MVSISNLYDLKNQNDCRDIFFFYLYDPSRNDHSYWQSVWSPYDHNDHSDRCAAIFEITAIVWKPGFIKNYLWK